MASIPGLRQARLGLASLTLGYLLPLLRSSEPFGKCGNRHQTIFHKDEDDEAFIQVLAEGLVKYAVEVFAFTLMPNHLVMQPANRMQPREMRGAAPAPPSAVRAAMPPEPREGKGDGGSF